MVVDYIRQTAGQTKEVVVNKAAHAKDATVDAGKKVVDYTSEKAVQPKDATIGDGQKTAACTAEEAQTKDSVMGAVEYTKGKIVGVGQSAISTVRETAATAQDTVKSTAGFKANEEEDGKDRALGEAKVMSIVMPCRT